MQTYVLKRLLLMIPTLFGVSLVVWGVTAAAPEPPISSQLPGGIEQGKKAGESGTMNQALKVYRAQYGLDKPVILNTYYSLDTEDVRQAVLESATGGAGSEEERISQRLDAQEQLVKWGYYAVPALMEIVEDARGDERDRTMAWLVKNAERVPRVEPGQAVDDESGAKNAVIAAENRILKLCEFAADDDSTTKANKVAAIRSWYDGFAAGFEEGDSVESVEAALKAGNQNWNARAVSALVEIVAKDGSNAAQAARALGGAARQNDAPIRNRIAASLGWPDDAPVPKHNAGIEGVHNWWHGAKAHWDFSGARWLRVVFLETRFASYWGNLLSFDLGYSSVHKEPVTGLIARRLKYSLTLSLTSLILAFLISVPLGLYSARTHGTIRERCLSVFVFILYSLPSFFVATLLIRFFAKGQAGSLEWVPTGGFESSNAWELDTWDRVKDIAWHIATPIFCMTYGSLAALSRYAKSGLLNVIRSDYVRTARAKGLSDFVVTYKHAARPGIIPVITLLGGTLPVIVSGSFIIEWIFQIPGFGLLMVDSVRNNDYNVIVGITLVTAVLVMIGILLSDLLYAVADPRISLS